jgi:putative transcriptional regulator
MSESNFKRIRLRLGLSQAAIAAELGVTQGNVSHYEVGRNTIPPDVAGRLISVAKKRGHVITFDDVYAAPKVKRTPRRSPAAAAA